MKSTDVTFRAPKTEPLLPAEQIPATQVVPTPKPVVESTQTVAGGLAHHAPSLDQQTTPNVVSLLVDQKTEAPHRRGRTAALRVKDVKSDFGVAQRKSFKPVVDLISPLHELIAQFKGKV